MIQFGRRWTRLQTALPQLQARERAAHTGIISEQCLEPNRARFSRQLKRISVQMDFVVRIRPRQPASPVSNASHVKNGLSDVVPQQQNCRWGTIFGALLISDL